MSQESMATYAKEAAEKNAAKQSGDPGSSSVEDFSVNPNTSNNAAGSASSQKPTMNNGNAVDPDEDLLGGGDEMLETATPKDNANATFGAGSGNSLTPNAAAPLPANSSAPLPTNAAAAPAAQPAAAPAAPTLQTPNIAAPPQQALQPTTAAPPPGLASPAAPSNIAPANAGVSSTNAPGAPALAAPAPTSSAPPINASTVPQANQFAGAPPIPGTRRVMAEGEAPIEYRVHPGDTLFDVCDQLLDEPGYWPKLWALNPEIKNPHFIFPNMRLRFYPGDAETPPSLRVVDEDEIIPVDKGPLNEQELVAEAIPPSLQNPLTPAALQERELVPQTEVIRGEDLQIPQEVADYFMVVGNRYNGGPIQVTIPAFIFAEEKSALGFIVSGRDDSVMSSTGMKVLIDGALSPGSTYTVLRPSGLTNNADGSSSDSGGYRYEFVGNVRAEQQQDSVAMAEITDIHLGIQTGDMVVELLSTKRSVDSLEAHVPGTPTPTTVIGFDNRGQLIGRTGEFIFLSKSEGNLSSGQFVSIYRGNAVFSAGSEHPKELSPIGVARILETTDAAAVGIIVESTFPITLGDRGTP